MARIFFVKKGFSALRDWVFSPATGPQESKEKLKKTLEILGKTKSGINKHLICHNQNDETTSLCTNRRTLLYGLVLFNTQGHRKHFYFFFCPPSTINVRYYYT